MTSFKTVVNKKNTSKFEAIAHIVGKSVVSFSAAMEKGLPPSEIRFLQESLVQSMLHYFFSLPMTEIDAKALAENLKQESYVNFLRSLDPDDIPRA